MGSMYGGYGGMGGMYGGMGGMGGMYGGMPGQDPNDPNSLTNSFSQSTQATFHMIESIVGAFGGFAQMLESTYMATHSSFFGEYRTITFVFRDMIVLTCLSNGLGRRAIRQPA
jgi:peroxin-13